MGNNLIIILSDVITCSKTEGHMCQHMAKVTKASYVQNNPDDKFPRFCGILHEIAAIRAGKSILSSDGSICGICPMGGVYCKFTYLQGLLNEPSKDTVVPDSE